jgi:pimeloyl-ACP methyl ester carboxylesterase/class 3 adenylate cyclase
MTEQPDVRYASGRDGIDIAYQVLGDGPVDLVLVPGFISHLDLDWALPHFAWLEQLDGAARVITFDKRGTGLSDRTLGFGSIEERADDIGAVMDAAGSERAFVMGVSEGGPMAIVFAASCPDRVRGLILYGTGARFTRAPDYPCGVEAAAAIEWWTDFIAAQWGTGKVMGVFLQNAPDPAAARDLLARFERSACTPKMAADIMRRNFEIDVRPILSSIVAPTVVIHASGDPICAIGFGRYLAEHIPGAAFREIPGDFHGSWRPEDVSHWRDAVLDFLSGAGAPPRTIRRALATVLFTDIVGSTDRARRIGDPAWHTLLDQHDRIVAAEVERSGGRLVKTTGDGVLATVEGPSRGIQCAQAIAHGLRPFDMNIRAGVHTGEVELRGDDVTGMGVVIARRICDLAGTGEILVSRTVKDLVTGSGITLVNRGPHSLKGVEDEWELFAAS